MPRISGGTGPWAAPNLTTGDVGATAPSGTGWSAGDGLGGPAAGGAPIPTGSTASGPIGAMGWSPPPTTPYSLPERVGLGVATIHRYDDLRVAPSTIAITVFTPVSTPEFPSAVLDLNAKKTSEILPDRCIVGDAGITRAFLGIDKRPGTPLDQALSKVVAEIPQQPDGTIDPEAAIQFVRVRTNQLIAWTAGSGFNDGRAEFPWDKAIQVDPKVWSSFKDVAFQPVGDLPYLTGETFPVVPLEKYISAGQGYCIQKALLASLVLERAGVPHRIVNGAVSQGPGKSVGHTWLELADGRILDPAWKQVGARDTHEPPVPGFFRFGGSWRFENQTFPYLRD